MIIVEKSKDLNPEFYSKIPMVSEVEKINFSFKKIFQKSLCFIHICESVLLQSHSTTNLLDFGNINKPNSEWCGFSIWTFLTGKSA